MLKNQFVKRAASVVLAGIMVLGAVPAALGASGDVQSYVPESSFWGNSISPSDRRATGPYALQIELSQANYRNLTMTPGASVNEMRWTWHSRSEVGGIRIYQAGSTTPISLGGAQVFSRPLGYGITSALGVTAALPLGSGGIEQGAQTRQAVADGATGIHSYPWFSVEEGTANDYFVHQISVHGLTADTAFEYVITGTINGVAFTSARKPFRTGPDRNSGFTFTAGGDPQIGIGDFTPGRENHGNNIPNPGIGFKSHIEDFYGWTNAVSVMAAYVPHASFFMPVGDQIDTNDGSFRRSQFMYDILLAPTAFHSLPILPVVGNHEANNNGWLWHQHYNLPIGHSTSAAAASNIRPHGANPWQIDFYMVWGNMLLIQLDGNTRNWGEGRLEWFENVIATYQPTTQWTVVTFHQPPYSVFRATNLGEKQQIIANWLPEFERLGVDVVLNGHCHVFSRTHQMLGNVPQLSQNWVGLDGTVTNGTNPTSVVYDATGIVYIAFNSMSGSGYRNVRNMGGRNYISAYNQNFRRNFSVIDVTNYSFAVHTYQVNDDGVSVSLVDTYTLVRGGALAQAAAADPRGLRQKLCPEQGINTDIINVGIVPNVARRAETALTAEALGLPATVEIEIGTSSNQRQEDVFGILGARALRDELNSYDFRVRPMNVAVNWDLSAIPADAAAREGQTFNVTGTLDLSRIITTAQTYPLPAPVAADATFTLAGVTQACPYAGQHVNFQGSPENMMLWRHGGITNARGLVATAQVTFGAAALQAPFRLSEFGTSTFHYSPRTSAELNTGAFNRGIFETWQTVRSGTGFGYFADRYNAVPMLITDNPPTIPLPGLQFRGNMGPTALANMGSIQYSPVGYDANPTFHYFSRVFYLPANFNPANIGSVIGSHRIDDSLILFINGVEIYRFNTNTNNNLVRVSERIDWATFNGHEADARNRSFHINYNFSSRYAGTRAANSDISVFDAASRTNLVAALRPGENILTAVVGDASANSMDIWFDLDLTINYNN
ncbi:MAG: metallophosphoesterase [Defluviitaleaceae bacterium]|nr:metallophosphoesterase [Defluviitaleaceae bacterium]